MSIINKESIIILLAAGNSERFKSGSKNIEKQFFNLGNRTIFEICLKNIHNLELNLKILPVIGKKKLNSTKNICKNYNTLPPIIGGKTRQESVYKALKELKNQDIKYVLIHDAARPLLDKDVILELYRNMNIRKEYRNYMNIRKE